ncbi:hypothetical protein ZWY2020_009781 [Hordeum vulgare]|nr:hypothetical protein ZWY2020_009781 [Hordeum vulgare]
MASSRRRTMVPGGLDELELHAVGRLGQEQVAATRLMGMEAAASGGSARAGGDGGGWLGQEHVPAVRFFFFESRGKDDG